MRARTLAGFVGVDAALDAPLHCQAHHRAERGVGAEGAAEDDVEHLRHAVVVDDHDDDGHQDEAGGHERHHHFGEVGDALDATEDHHAQQQRDHDADAQLQRLHRFHAEGLAIERTAQGGATAGVDDAVGDRVGLHARHQEAGGDDRGDGEGQRVPLQAHGLFDVVGRATAVAAFGVLGLVDLRQGAFHVRGGRAEEAHHPHPEDRTGAAEGDGGGHAGDVADTHAAGHRHGQGLERGHAGVGFLTLDGEAAHLEEAADLHEARAQAEEQAGAQAHEDQCLAPDDAVDEMYGCFHARSLQSAGCKDVPSAGRDRSILPDRRPLR